MQYPPPFPPAPLTLIAENKTPAPSTAYLATLGKGDGVEPIGKLRNRGELRADVRHLLVDVHEEAVEDVVVDAVTNLDRVHKGAGDLLLNQLPRGAGKWWTGGMNRLRLREVLCSRDQSNQANLGDVAHGLGVAAAITLHPWPSQEKRGGSGFGFV